MNSFRWTLKEQFTQKLKILSLFSQPHVVSNLPDLLTLVEHKRKYFEKDFFETYHES